MNEICNSKVQEYANLCMSVMDSLQDNIAVLDSSGKVVFVNNSWKIFTQQNSGHHLIAEFGENYLDVCRRASWECEYAVKVLDGIQQVMKGQYSCLTYKYNRAQAYGNKDDGKRRQVQQPVSQESLCHADNRPHHRVYCGC